MIFAFFAAVLNAALIQNIVTSSQAGLEATRIRKGRIKPVFEYALTVSVLSLITFLIAYPLYQYALVPLDIAYFNLLLLGFVLIGVHAAFVILKRYVKFLNKFPSEPYVILNTALVYMVLTAFLQTNFVTALSYTLGTLAGFVVILVIYQTIISRLSISPIPKSFRGLPIILMVLGLIAIALSGLNGIF